MIKQITIPASWIDTGCDEPRYESAVFKLGLGRCGKVVVALQLDIAEGFVQVKQRCDDGTIKNFLYRVSDLIGRIEIEEFTG